MTQTFHPSAPKKTPPREVNWKREPYKPSREMREAIARVEAARGEGKKL